MANMELRKQALADYLKIDTKEITVCSARINDITTMQARNMLYLVGTKEEVNAGIRSYFEHNLGDLDSTFIGSKAHLDASDAQLVERLCEILSEEIATEILNEALLFIVKKCGDLQSLIDSTAAEVDRGEFLAVDGVEHVFEDYLIYKFREGRCSDFD
ncbi:MAG: hypothetical protein A4E44_01971 [Methanosaeta sp. PtaB.Bin018]|jgi:hypothetical protein|nr:hypothetical protein [Methanothrix sp.]OPX74399.1 MAG: hypothetical protein A4E44_01971 [Methanosaeta sp. PtaB.Bin018]OPY44050.1 MAG: hypothetical protein A4E46_01540 [Methanosaeta sp. PtaU1.Bin016]